jgi:serine/threonine protein kinase
MDLKPGDKLGPYEIVSAIGSGGMGEVWKGRDTRLNRDVAIKTSRLGFSGRFKTEAQLIASLNHPNVCTLYDVGPDYLVMEYIEGPTLAERVWRRSGRADTNSVRRCTVSMFGKDGHLHTMECVRMNVTPRGSEVAVPRQIRQCVRVQNSGPPRQRTYAETCRARTA